VDLDFIRLGLSPSPLGFYPSQLGLSPTWILS